MAESSQKNSLKEYRPGMQAPSVLLACLFLSGALSLVYEVLWIRNLGLVFGTTVVAMTSVLAVFFGGLAIGNHFFGRLAAGRRHPIRV